MIAVVASFVPLQSAAAQSLFDALFGTAKPSYPAQGQGLSGGVNQGVPYRMRPATPQRAPGSEDADEPRPSRGSGGGSYQTVCVRLCDGFYWPVSYGVSRARFYRDGNVCKSSCGSETKLFHYPASGGQIEDAVDNSGLAYQRLPTAFKYRKALIDGCTCKPAPWSATEIARHQAYADAEAGIKPGDRPKVAELPPPKMSGSAESVVAGAAGEAVSAPAAVSVAEAVPAASTADTATKVEPVIVEPRSGTAERKPIRVRAAPEEQIRSRTVRTTGRPSAAPSKAGGGFGGLFGGGQQTLTWPGDPPPRYR